MRNENLHNLLVTWLEGRGRWLRAGRDNLPNYLSKVLHCGSNQAQAIKEVLLNPDDDVLHVEHVNGRITRVGLKAWLAHDAVELDKASLDAGKQPAALGDPQPDPAPERAVEDVDVEAVFELATEMERQLADATKRLQALDQEVAMLKTQLAAPRATDTQEMALLRAQLAGAVSSRASLNKAFVLKCGELKESRDELKDTLKLLGEFDKFKPLLQHPVEALALAEILGSYGSRVSVLDAQGVAELLATG